MTATVISFGCRLNHVDSAALRRIAPGGDTVVINSCAVTAEAVREARKAIRRARRERPDARIIVTGCAAQTEPATFAAMTEVDQVLGTLDRTDPAAFAATAPRVRVSDLMAPAAPLAPIADADRARAFVAVQTGCDHRCTFCIIPFGRGPSRSAPAGAVVEQVKALVGAGVREVVLTGVDLTAWGGDLPGRPTLGALVERLLRHVPDLPRLRLSSLDAVEVDTRLFDQIAHEPRLMPHLHLSLQSGDDMILKRMKRRHSRTQALEFCERVRAARPDIAFGADLIAGFPTETEAMAENSVDLVRRLGIVFGHIFPYSERAATPAARMPAVPLPLRRARAQRLRAAADANRAAWLASLIGTSQRLLVERTDGSGHGESFASIRLAGGAPRRALVDVRVTGVDGDTLVAEAA